MQTTNGKNIQKFNSFMISKGRPIGAEILVKKIPKKDIFDKMLLSKFKELEKVYQKIPDTTCANCGRCCTSFFVNTIYSIEYLNIVKKIDDTWTRKDIDKLNALGKINFYLGKKYQNKSNRKPKKWRICIFRDEKNKMCRIYKYRPLTCRFYATIELAKGKKIRCSKINFIDKKNKTLLTHDYARSLSQKIADLSENYAYPSKDGKTILVTKTQDINTWFLLK